MNDAIQHEIPGLDIYRLKKTLLLRTYDIYDAIVSEFESACRDSCATCCTQNVLATTLETSVLLEYGGNERLGQVRGEVVPNRMQPLLTVNTFADQCIHSQEPPPSLPIMVKASCPLLEQTSCAVYQGRPFACRSMWSQTLCRPDSAAIVDPLLVSINSVFQQIIEDIDAGGLYGNLLDIMLHFGTAEIRQSYHRGQRVRAGEGLIFNAPNPGFLVPPEHRSYVGRSLAPLWRQTVSGFLFKEAISYVRDYYGEQADEG
jgi:Fe-S-cluster containining protein